MNLSRLFFSVSAAAGLCAATTASAQSNSAKHLRNLYETEGENVMIALFIFSDTRETTREVIQDEMGILSTEWGQWEKEPLAKKLAVFEAVGAEWDELDPKERERRRGRLHAWLDTFAQIYHLKAQYKGDGDEEFCDFLAGDQLVMKWVIDYIGHKRAPIFGQTIGSTQMSTYPASLAQFLIDQPEDERVKCISRLTKRIAKRGEPEN
ncbi:MAG: hypothetical protein AAF585_13665 [Verrucomicrobiota bacterium]